MRRGWDQEVGEVAPKSTHGRRKVPVPAALRDRLVEYLMDGPTKGRIFAGIRDGYRRGRDAALKAEVEQPTLHECRHGYASVMIAAGVNVKALSTFMGDANIRITLDQYGHLLPGADRPPGCWTPSSPAGWAVPRSSRRRRRVHGMSEDPDSPPREEARHATMGPPRRDSASL